jgi:hypothetical protein
VRPLLICTVLLGSALALTSGCGHEIGDSCVVTADCGTDIGRTCDALSFEGYCTEVGCDYDTCPEEAVCIRFFAGVSTNLPCDPRTEDADQEMPSEAPDDVCTALVPTDDCTSDEVCTLTGNCVPRSSEVRYCMKSCGSNDDCRDGYECRDEDLMVEHGGEPVAPPDDCTLDALKDHPAFCAQAPAG